MERAQSRLRAASELWTVLALLSLGWWILVVLAAVHDRSVGPGFSAKQALGFDFSVNVWHPAGQVLHGHGIYPTRLGPNMSHRTTADPPLLAVLTTPLRLLPYSVALGVFDALAFAGFALSLWVVGVRDWRIYCIALGSAPVASGVICGQVTGLVALGYALAWRYRRHTSAVGLVVGLLVALKLLALPLIIWLALTRRPRSALIAGATSVTLALASWAAIDFQGLTSYPRLLRLCASSWAPESYSIKAAGLAVGLPGTASTVLGCLVAGLLGSWGVWMALRRQDLASFGASVATGIYLSPVVHMHYALWLIVLVAIVRPRPSWIWLAVIALWISGTEPAISTWRLEAELGISLMLIWFVIQRRREGARVRWERRPRRGLQALRSAG